MSLGPLPSCLGPRCPHMWRLPEPVPAQTLPRPTRCPKFSGEGQGRGWVSKQTDLYLQSSLGTFLAAYLSASLLFQLHGQAQGLDDISQGREMLGLLGQSKFRFVHKGL